MEFIVNGLTQKNVIGKELTVIKAIELFNELPSQTSSFVTIKIDDIKCKFTFVKPDCFMLDIPVVLNKIHKQRYTTKNQAAQYIRAIFKKSNMKSLKGFVDVPICHYTLDQMLEFKQEDEMQLKGKVPNIIKVK